MTKDKTIRFAFKKILQDQYGDDPNTKIIEELGVAHGAARIDIASVNGIIHGYELKSDADTLNRLPEQMEIYNMIFDKITLIVGKTHVHEAIKKIPDWWGITLAKISSSGDIVFLSIREAEFNKKQDYFTIAKLLWRQEALYILEELKAAKGIRSKSRDTIYNRLVETLDPDVLKKTVNEQLRIRLNWRSDTAQTLCGG